MQGSETPFQTLYIFFVSPVRGQNPISRLFF